MLDAYLPCRRKPPSDGWAVGVRRPQQRNDGPRPTALGPVARAFWEGQPIFAELQAKMSAMRALPKMELGDLYAPEPPQ